MTSRQTHISGKNILVISPQSWGVMHVSKHHYAIELARMGNRVYFLNPPLLDTGSPIEITQHDSIEKLTLVTYRLFFPYNLRFHMRWLYDRLMRRQMRKVLNKIGVSFDIAWCFDTNLFADLRAFGSKKVVYHIADQIMSESGVRAALTADLVVAVDQALLGKLEGVNVPKCVVGHGLAEPFALLAEERLANGLVEQPNSEQVLVGYVGNLLISSLDRATFQRMIEENKQVVFHFWGAYDTPGNNVGGASSLEARAFVDFLKNTTNVLLHGAVAPDRLAEEIQPMDAFLLCYDSRADINGGCNSHKVLEYLSTGKVVLSGQMSAYESFGNLLLMADKKDNSDLAKMFTKMIQNLLPLNAPSLQRARLELALNNRYTAQILQIQTLLNGVLNMPPLISNSESEVAFE